MKSIKRINPEGKPYTQAVPTEQSDYPVFPSQSAKESVLQTTQDLYADGKLIRGSVNDGEGGHCIMGVFQMVGIRSMMVNLTKLSPIVRMFVTTNNEGPGGYSPGVEEGKYEPVTPSAYQEVMMLIKDCPVEGEEK